MTITIFEDDKKSSRTKLMKDYHALKINFNENELKFRNDELKLLKEFVNNYINKNNAFDIEIIGDPFTGKTHLTHELTSRIKQLDSIRIIKIYSRSTLNEFLRKIYIELSEKRAGVTLSNVAIKEKIKEILIKTHIKLIIIFDDSYLEFSKSMNEIFDYLYNDYYLNINCLVSLIRLRCLKKAPLKCKPNDNIIQEQIFLKNYSLDQIIEILKDKIKIGFYPRTISLECIEELANWIYSRNNMYMGMNFLSQVVFEAEVKGNNKITLENLKKYLDNN